MFLTKDSKSPYYQVVYFVNGKRTKKSTKKTSQLEAEKFLEDFKKNFNAIEEKKIITLSLFRDEYILYCKKSFSKSYVERAVIPSFKKLILHTNDIPLTSISSRHIDQFITSIYNYSHSAASLYHRTLKAAFNKAIIWNYILVNPFNKIKSPKVEQSFPVFLSQAELILLLNNTKDQMLKDIFTTAFYTGMRLGELLNMKWDWIDFSQNIITIKNSSEFNSKNKRERIIPIHPKVQTILQYYFQLGRPSSRLVFYRYEGIKLIEDFVSKQFKKAVRAAKLNDKIHFHSLRHSFASALVQRGASLYTVKELLGHGNIKTTQIYSHLKQDSLNTAVNLL